MFEDALFSSPAVTLRDNIIPVWYFSSLERIQGGAILEEGNSWLSLLYCSLIFKVPARFSLRRGGQGDNSLIVISEWSQYVML